MLKSKNIQRFNEFRAEGRSEWNVNCFQCQNQRFNYSIIVRWLLREKIIKILKTSMISARQQQKQSYKIQCCGNFKI